MSDGVYAAVAAQATAERQLESITTNLANLQTTGFKRQSATAEAFEVVLDGKLRQHLALRRTVDFSQGQLGHDGEPTDLALEGPGFFVVETPRGEAYTRNGRFHVDENGVLQTLEGFAVAWEGSAASIDPRGLAITVGDTGAVSQGEAQIGRLLVKSFAQPQALRPDRQGYFHAPRGAAEVPHEARVVQGALERANVNPIEEMTAMIVVQRRFENAARVFAAIDQSYRRLTQSR